MNNPQPLANNSNIEDNYDDNSNRAAWIFFIIIIIVIISIMATFLVRHMTSAQVLQQQRQEVGRDNQYQSPELGSQLGEDTRQPKVELTELGKGDTLTNIILYENCTGRLLFSGPTSTTVTVLHVKTVFCEPDYKFRDGKVFYGNGSLFMD